MKKKLRKIRDITAALLSISIILAPLGYTPAVMAQEAETEETNSSVDEQVGYNEEFFSMNDILFYDPRAQICGYTTNGGANVTAVNTSDVSSGFSLGTDNSLRAVNLARQLMVDFGLKDYQAAGIVGNFMLESGGVHLPPDINEGTKTPAPPMFIGGYGWAQWTGGRQKSFINFAISNGYMASNSEHATDAANYAYLKYELLNTELSTLPAVLSATDAASAATQFEDKFERAGVPALTKRIAHANDLYSALQNGTGVSGATATEDGAAAAIPGLSADCVIQGSGLVTPGAAFNDVVFPLSVRKSDIKNPEIFANGTTAKGDHPYVAFDIYAKAGTVVVALAKGAVTQITQPSPGSMGGSVTLYDSATDTHVFYTHMSPHTSLKKGDIIPPGVALGTLVSVNNYPSINVDHLHIDAGSGQIREGCSRTNPSGAACNNRIDIGPDLYNAWLVLPD